MRNYLITYVLRGEVKSEIFRAIHNVGAYRMLLGKLSRRDRLFYHYIRTTLV